MSKPATDKKERRAARVPEQGRRATVTFRCLPDVRAKLQEAAAKSGRSASEEMEHRLARSFLHDDLIATARETIRQEMRAEFEARRGPQSVMVNLTPRELAALENASKEPGAIIWMD